MLTALVRPARVMDKALALEIITRRYRYLDKLRARRPVNESYIAMQRDFCGEAVINAKRHNATPGEINTAITSARILEGACS